jgi:hypothetical protein
MKKALFIIVAFCICPAVFSQETATVKIEPKNEIKLNLGMFLALYPEISYERILGDDLGFGVSAAVSLDDDSENIFQITPYFRFYFGGKPTRSFFIEANMGLVGFKEENYSYYYDYSSSQSYDYSEKNVVDFGLGVAIGYKYINRKGFTGEIYAGVGRTFDDRAYPRLGITIGKQF